MATKTSKVKALPGTRPLPEKPTYLSTHPWLTFRVDMTRASAEIWLALGEIQSKCEHLAGAPLQPEVAEKMHSLFLAKGIMATTAIEGNTLSEEEVERKIAGTLDLPASKAYLGIEVDNVLQATNRILGDVVDMQDAHPLTVAEIMQYNEIILRDLKVADDVVPGEVREHKVEVGRYRGAPAAECEPLLQKMVDWLNGPTFAGQKQYRIVYGVLKAIMAHLYLAWIHPFGDGNGRTARLLEVRLLLEAGAPSAAAHLLSNFYNQTRTEYYRQLDAASRSGGDVMPFIKYATQGFCEQLREQITIVRDYQVDMTWRDYVHQQFRDRKSTTDHRRRHLALAISDATVPVLPNTVRHLTPQLAELYAGKTGKTIVRDLNDLRTMGLIRRSTRGFLASKSKVIAFLPKLEAVDV